MRNLFFVGLLFWCPMVFSQQEIPVDAMNLQGQIPRAEFSSTRYHFGSIYRGQRLIHEFPFRNMGNGFLVLSGLHASCGCINTKILDEDGKKLKNTFKPGESGSVFVEFDSSAFVGSVVRTVTVDTNVGSSAAPLTLTLSADVLQEFFINPEIIYLGHLQKNEEKTFFINVSFGPRPNVTNINQLKNNDDEWVKSSVFNKYKSSIFNLIDNPHVIVLETSLPYIKTQLSSVGSNTEQIRLTFGGKNIPIGPVDGNLIVWNNSVYNKRLQIPIVGEVVGHTKASAKYVEFGIVNQNKTSARLISFRSLDKSFAIVGVEVSLRQLPELLDLKENELFDIRKTRLESNVILADPEWTGSGQFVNGYKVEFKLVYPKRWLISGKKDFSRGINISGNFLVKTNDPDYKEISVPFFGILRRDL